VVVGAVLVSALTVLNPILGVVWAALLLGFGAGRALYGSHPRPAEPSGRSRGADGKHRVLVVANETVTSRPLWEEIEDRCGDHGGEVMVVAPALTDSRATLWASDLDAAIAQARERLVLSLRAARDAGLDVSGRVGDADPNVAIEDALRDFAADEIVVWMHTPERSPWLERGMVQRAREEIGLPVTHVVVDPLGEDAAPGPE
jgi:hypothetical protein